MPRSSESGRTRRVLLSDALLADYSDDEIEVVLAHELAHHAHHDIWKTIVYEATVVVAACGAANLVMQRFGAALGMTGLRDVGGLPLLVVVAGAVVTILAPVRNVLSRRHERLADQYALELTKNPTALVSSLRRFGEQTLAEERPSRLVEWLFYTHPRWPTECQPPEPRRRTRSARLLLLLRLFQHTPICSVGVCPAQDSPRVCPSFSANSPPKTPADSIWLRAGGRTDSCVRAVGAGRVCARRPAPVAMHGLPAPGLADLGDRPPQRQAAADPVVLGASLMTTDTRGISAVGLQRQLGLSRNETAWLMLHKLRRAMVNAAREPLHGEIAVDDTWIGGPQPGLRGSRQLKGRRAALVLVAVERRGRGSGRVRMGSCPTSGRPPSPGFSHSAWHRARPSIRIV